MRTLFVLILTLFCPVLVSAAESTVVKISSTIGPVDAGIIPLLAETFSKKSGL